MILNPEAAGGTRVLPIIESSIELRQGSRGIVAYMQDPSPDPLE